MCALAHVRDTDNRCQQSLSVLQTPKVLIIHSPKSITSGMLGRAETSKFQAGVAGNLVTVSGGDAESIKSRRSTRQGSSAHVLRRGFM